MATQRMRTGRGAWWFVIALIILAVLVGLDFGGRAIAQRVMASKIEQQGLPNRPDVSIGGFPFLTQVAARNFRHITIDTSDVPAGSVTISHLHATGSDIRLDSFAFSKGTIGTLNGTALIGYASLNSYVGGQLGGLSQAAPGTGLKLSSAGPDEVKATVNLVITSGTLTWRVSKSGPRSIRLQLVSSTGALSALSSSAQNVNLALPKLPLGLQLDSVRVTSQGVVARVSGRNVPFSNN